MDTKPSPGTDNPSQDPLDAAKANGLAIDDDATAGQVTAAASDLDIARSHIASHGRSRKPIIIIVSIAAAVLVVGLVTAYYYFVVRLQDSDYVQATNYVDIVLNDVKETSGIATELHNIGDQINNDDLKRATDFRLQSQSFSANLTQFETSDPVVRDGTVKAQYNKDAAEIKGYGSAISEASTSIETFETAMVKWNKFVTDLNAGSIRSLDEYDAATKDVNQYFQAHTSVVQKDFNDKIYSKARDACLSTIVDLRTYIWVYALYVSGTNNSSTRYYNAVLQKLVQDLKNVQDIVKDAKSYTFTLSTDPTAKLQALQATMNDRMSLFLR